MLLQSGQFPCPYQLHTQEPPVPPEELLLELEELDEEFEDELELELLDELEPPQLPLKQSEVSPKPITPLQCMVSE